jgi:hypothetical protein
MERVTAATLKPILKAHIAAQAHLMTDESPVYRWTGKHFAHDTNLTHTGDVPKLRIPPVPFDDLMSAVVRVKPPLKPERKPRPGAKKPGRRKHAESPKP